MKRLFYLSLSGIRLSALLSSWIICWKGSRFFLWTKSGSGRLCRSSFFVCITIICGNISTNMVIFRGNGVSVYVFMRDL